MAAAVEPDAIEVRVVRDPRPLRGRRRVKNTVRVLSSTAVDRIGDEFALR